MYRQPPAVNVVGLFTQQIEKLGKPSLLAQLAKFKELSKATIGKEKHLDKGERAL